MVPAADSVEIAVESGDCTWTQSTKTLAFTGNEKCVVTVTAKKAGYEDRIRTFSVDSALQAIDITDWGTYGSVLADEVAVDAPGLTGSDNDATKSYTSTTPHICTVAPDTGAVTGMYAGDCGIALTLSKDGHNDNTHIYNVVVQGLFSSLLWEAFPSEAVQGVPTSALSPPVSSPPADDYTIAYKSGDCAWDDSSSILSFSGIVECILTVTAAKSGYSSKSEDFSVTPVGTIAATSGSYGKAFFIGQTASSPLTGLDPSDADTAYVSADDNICTVDNSTGAVTGVDEGECRVTLTLSKTGYNDKTIEYILPVVLSPKDFKDKHLFQRFILGIGTRPTFADIDGDGDSDLVVGLSDGTLKYYRKNPSGSLTVFSELTGTDNPFNGVNVGYWAFPAFGDVDGDGDLDLVVGEYRGTLKYFLNESADGSITFTAKTAASDNPFNGVDVGYYSAPALADVDKDGKVDLVVGEEDGILNYFLNESVGETITFTAKTVASENPFNNFDVGQYSAPKFVNLDGDRDLDLVVGDRGGDLNYFLNESTDTTTVFTAKTSTDNPLNGLEVRSSAVPSFADIDGDNDLDVVMGNYDGILTYFENESTPGTMTFTKRTRTEKKYFEGINVTNAATPVFGDVDKDGDLDLVMGGKEGTLKFFLNESASGTITFTEKKNTDNPFNGFDAGGYSRQAFADINGDGKIDLVVGGTENEEGTLTYFLNESTGGTITFTKKTSTEDPFNSLDVGSLPVRHLPI